VSIPSVLMEKKNQGDLKNRRDRQDNLYLPHSSRSYMMFLLLIAVLAGLTFIFLQDF